MFKKLVANLPFNPSLIHQMGFYADRLHQEKSIRRLSFILIALAMSVQSLAIISPPEQSLALSSSHIINGLKTKQDILNAWKNDPSVSKIYEKFGVTYEDVKSLTDLPNTTIRSNDGNDWWTIGRNSLSSYTNVADVYKNSQVKIEYESNSYIYYRKLRAWDIRNAYNTYKAFKGTISKTGESFWILVDCGNFTKIGPYDEPDPKLELRKTIENQKEGAVLKPGDTFSFRFEYRNKQIDSVAKDVVLEDTFDVKNYDIISPKDKVSAAGFMRLPVGNLDYQQTFKVLKVTVRLKSELPNGTETCNSARLIAENAPDARGGPACVKVVKPAPCPYDSKLTATDPNCKKPPQICPYNASIKDINDPKCVPPNPCRYDPSVPDENSVGCVKTVVVCNLLDIALNRSERKATFKTKVTANNEKVVKISQYNYEFGDGMSQSIKSTEFTNTTSHTYEPGGYTASVTVNYSQPSEDGTTEKQVSCEQPIDFDADEPLGQSKTVANITRELDADKTLESKVRAGDVLEYTLATINSQNYDRTDIRIEDYVGDLVDYSTIDTAFLQEQGGTYDEKNQKVIWEKKTIPANSELKLVFRINVLNPIPSTNQPSTVTTDFDCRISNEYGNEITLEVQCPVVKGLETIPNTGSGTSLIFGTGLTALVGYFFARARLFNKEIDIIRSDFAMTGGM